MSPRFVTLGSGLRLPVIRGAPHPCGYFPDRVATMDYVLTERIEPDEWQEMMDARFRRSGDVFYATACDGCAACVPIRVPVARFAPSRSQRRAVRKNADVEVTLAAPAPDDEHYDLHERYQEWKHAGHMSMSPGDFERFFGPSPVDTWEMQYRVAGRLVGVGLIDIASTSISSVYFYFDPVEARRSLGVFSSLCEIAECRRRGLSYWYGGYYVAGCAKMEYKSQFRPFELLGADGEWAETTTID